MPVHFVGLSFASAHVFTKCYHHLFPLADHATSIITRIQCIIFHDEKVCVGNHLHGENFEDAPRGSTAVSRFALSYRVVALNLSVQINSTKHLLPPQRPSQNPRTPLDAPSDSTQKALPVSAAAAQR